jgi:predicted secreted protein
MAALRLAASDGTLTFLARFAGERSRRMEQEIHKSGEDARAGSTPHIVRYVLSVSLLLAIFAMLFLLIWGATLH